MVAPLIKICGLTDAAAVDAAVAAGADMIGFVFFERSPRHLRLPDAAALAVRAGPRVQRVGLTVDADDATLDALVARVPLDMLQLHGRETPARVAAVRSRYGLPVLRAVPIGREPDFAAIASFDRVADRLLFDAPADETGARPGGNGQTFDWSALSAVRTRVPWLLAGGLHAANVAEALATTNAGGVDVSSGVERAPGVKDPDRIAAFVVAARGDTGVPRPRTAAGGQP